MKRIFSILIVLLTIIFPLVSQVNDVYLQFIHSANTQPVVLNETVFPIWNGKMVKLTRAEFYLSKFELVGKDGLTAAYPENYMLINAGGSQDKILLGQSTGLDMASISFYVGVDKDKNHLDPTLYPASSALSLKEPSMHWGWAGGYRFMAIEGLVDLDNDGKPESEFQYHNLGDELYKQAKVVIDADESSNEVNLKIVLDYAKLFDNLTMVGNNIVHGSSTKNNTMLTNATTGGFFSQQKLSSNDDQAIFKNQDVKYTVDGQFLNLQFSEKCLDGVFCQIVDPSGRKLYNAPVSNLQASIPLTSLSATMVYLTLIKDNTVQLTTGIVVTH